jgi:hypothetical protein
MWIYLHKKEKTDAERLLEFVAIQILLKGGIVSVVEPEKMIDTESLAALFHY